MGENIYIDPAFMRDSQYSYVNYQEDDLPSVLCFALARNKNDLILHQQRIEFHAKFANQNLLFSSIVDLFIALGKKGEQYKSRILDKYRGQLTNNHTILLTKALVNGINPIDVVQNLDQSLLNLGHIGKPLTADMAGMN